MRELIVENSAVELAEQTGWYVQKMQFIGIRGCPDRWFFKRGRLLIVEFKRRGGVLDGHQVRRRQELGNAGFKVHVIDSYDAFVKLLADEEFALDGFRRPRVASA